MKKLLLIFTAVLFSTVSFSQKYGYVNTQYILEKMPEYKQAQKSLDQLAEQWQKEAETMSGETEKLRQAYQREQFLLSDEMKKQRLDEISSRDKELMEFQKRKFGVNGELFQKRQELIKPVQDKIYKALQEIAEQGGYTFIFDKSNSAAILYADPKADLSDKVLKKLGL